MSGDIFIFKSGQARKPVRRRGGLRAEALAPPAASLAEVAGASCSSQEALFEYAEGGQSGSGSQGTL